MRWKLPSAWWLTNMVLGCITIASIDWLKGNHVKQDITQIFKHELTFKVHSCSIIYFVSSDKNSRSILGGAIENADMMVAGTPGYSRSSQRHDPWSILLFAAVVLHPTLKRASTVTFHNQGSTMLHSLCSLL